MPSLPTRFPRKCPVASKVPFWPKCVFFRAPTVQSSSPGSGPEGTHHAFGGIPACGAFMWFLDAGGGWPVLTLLVCRMASLDTGQQLQRPASSLANMQIGQLGLWSVCSADQHQEQPFWVFCPRCSLLCFTPYALHFTNHHPILGIPKPWVYVS